MPLLIKYFFGGAGLGFFLWLALWFIASFIDMDFDTDWRFFRFMLAVGVVLGFIAYFIPPTNS